MAEVPARHGDGLEAVELVARVLGFGPTEELLPGHDFAEGDARGCGPSIGGGRPAMFLDPARF